MLLFVVTSLKIIGILLLTLLGILGLLLLTVFFVPLRWQGRGSWEEKPEGVFQLRWLFPLLSVQVSYFDSWTGTVKLFGISVWRLEKEEEHSEPEEIQPEAWQSDADGTAHAQADSSRSEVDWEKPVSQKPAQSEAAPIETQREEIEQSRQQAEKDWSGSDFEVFIQERPETGKTDSPRQRKKAWKQTLSSMLQSVKQTFLHGKETLQAGREALEQAVRFFGDEKNQNTFRLLKRQLFRLLRHLFPKTLSGTLTFGLEDPYRMGQALSAAALCYPFYAEQVTVVPVFGETVFQGNLQMKGRIRLGTLLWLGGRMLFDKNFRVLVKKFLNRGGKKDGR